MLKQYKINSQINVPEVRLVADDGKQIGILKRDEALDYALGQGADLVLIGEMARPPVAKVIDFKKFLYQEQKKEEVEKKATEIVKPTAEQVAEVEQSKGQETIPPQQ